MKPSKEDLTSGVTSGGGGGGGGAESSEREISADLPGKKRQGKNGNGAEKKENQKREGRKLKMEGGKVKWGKDFFFYQEKAFHAKKKSVKMTLPTLKNIALMPLDLDPTPNFPLLYIFTFLTTTCWSPLVKCWHENFSFKCFLPNFYIFFPISCLVAFGNLTLSSVCFV